MNPGAAKLGMVGLGVMGRNLLLNLADHGYAVAGFDVEPDKVDDLAREAEGRDIQGAKTLPEFIQSLKVPRVVLMLVPAGPPVDSVIRNLLPYLREGDVVIDGGNSHFVDTDLRQKTLSEQKIDLLGVGISGGDTGPDMDQV